MAHTVALPPYERKIISIYTSDGIVYSTSGHKSWIGRIQVSVDEFSKNKSWFHLYDNDNNLISSINGCYVVRVGYS